MSRRLTPGSGKRMSQPTRTEPASISRDLRGLLNRYSDLVSAQENALQRGLVDRAVMLSKSAESVFAEVHRVDRRLTAARALHPVDPGTWHTIERQLRATALQAQTALNRLGSVLRAERTRLLDEFKRLGVQGADHGPAAAWSAPPTRLNVRT